MSATNIVAFSFSFCSFFLEILDMTVDIESVLVIAPRFVTLTVNEVIVRCRFRVLGVENARFHHSSVFRNAASVEETVWITTRMDHAPRPSRRRPVVVQFSGKLASFRFD
jgi:hypothetical protein